MSGQETYQVVGEAVLIEGKQFSEDDIKMVMDQTEMDREIVIEHLQKNDGDIAETIMGLKKL
jgi:NACalpha-BTF3-like transcription factor